MGLVETFNQYHREILEFDKRCNNGKDHNFIQELHANTELFDLSHVKAILKPITISDIHKDGWVLFSEDLKDLTLPFRSNFCKVAEENGSKMYMFCYEDSPTVFLGAFHTIIKLKNGFRPLMKPFRVNTELGVCGIHFKYDDDITITSNEKEKLEDKYIEVVASCLHLLNDVTNYVVAEDREIQPRTEYYPRKHASTLKVTGRPIYYLIQEKKTQKPVNLSHIKSRGHLTISNAFKVRGHWRRISESSYGKNRAGKYEVQGMTWVTEHVRGEGELIHKLRVLK